MGVRLKPRRKGAAPKRPRQPLCDGALGLYALTILLIVVVGLYPAEAGDASEMNLHANQAQQARILTLVQSAKRVPTGARSRGPRGTEQTPSICRLMHACWVLCSFLSAVDRQ